MKIKLITNTALVLVLLVVLLPRFGYSVPESSQQSTRSRNVKANLVEYLERINAYGFSGQVLLAENGQILLNKAYGLADREKHLGNQVDTPFNVASFTKQFTATAILQLQSEGKLTTNDAINKYLDNVPEDKTNITIHNLLTHTSGLSRGQDGKKNSQYRDEVVAAILRQPLAARTNEKFLYSNSGYHLLAAIIEKVSGQTYPAYLTEKFFKPAGMLYSGFYPDEKWNKVTVAQTHNEWKKLASFTEWNKVWNYGSGSVVSTATDLFQWFKALKANKILPADETKKLFKSYTPSFDENTGYGYGWYIEKINNGRSLIFHGGDNPGYHSEVRWYAEDDRMIIILTNYEQLEPDGVAIQKRIIANNLYRIMAGEEYKQPPDAIKLSARDQKRFEGEYALPGGRFKIWRNGSYLNIGAEGQDAINAIAGYEGETAKKYSESNKLTAFILESIFRGEQEKIKTRISTDEFNFYVPFLVEQLNEFQKNFGGLKKIQIQGTTSFPWDKDIWRTNVILHLDKGSVDLFLGWENGKLNDVTTEIGRPFPLIMPFVPNSKTKFSTFEFLRSRETQVTFKHKNTLSVRTGGGELKAARQKKAGN